MSIKKVTAADLHTALLLLGIKKSELNSNTYVIYRDTVCKTIIRIHVADLVIFYYAFTNSFGSSVREVTYVKALNILGKLDADQKNNV